MSYASASSGIPGLRAESWSSSMEMPSLGSASRAGVLTASNSVFTEDSSNGTYSRSSQRRTADRQRRVAGGASHAPHTCDRVQLNAAVRLADPDHANRRNAMLGS